MNAKELRKAAEYIVEQWDDHDSKRLVAGDELFFNADGEPDAVTFARHILATVREDDDEPVTPERLVELGFESSGHDVDSKWFSHPSCSFAIVIRNDGQNWIYYDGEFQSSMFDPRNMGEVRQLLERCGVPL